LKILEQFPNEAPLVAVLFARPLNQELNAPALVADRWIKSGLNFLDDDDVES